MHIVLVSACKKLAVKRTRRVLDSYAQRRGPRTWLTPITEQGLRELHQQLRRTATRNTAVACYRNDGRKRMQLLWITGNRKLFDAAGRYPVGSRTHRTSTFPAWGRICATLATSAGLMHDIGKFGKAFQDKLRSPKPIADPVRHEWLSWLFVRNWLDATEDARDWDTLWAGLGKQQYKDKDPFTSALTTPTEVLLFLIATHHRLFGGASNMPGTEKHIRRDGYTHQPIPVDRFTPETQSAFEKALRRVEGLGQNSDPLYWRGITLVSRAALILADHHISSLERPDPTATAHANTVKGKLNQELNWHLQNVGAEAGRMVHNMLTFTPPALDIADAKRIDTRVPGTPTLQRFQWQNIAADALARSAEDNDVPHLIISIASTGSGKTRMNARALAALSQGQPLRIATALNLRTLTLQTGDAYSQELRIPSEDLAVVLGSRVAKALHSETNEANVPAGDDGDENPTEPTLSTTPYEYIDAPEWLKPFIARDASIGAITGAPVLVSTIDFLIAAGEPHRQGHHALALLRLMTSDLVLDEIDSFDPKAMLAVMRLAMLAGFFGRNLVASSATLAYPVANILWRSYTRGIEMRSLVTGASNKFVTAVIDNAVPKPTIGVYREVDEFAAAYRVHVRKVLETLTGQSQRIASILRPADPSADAFADAVIGSINDLHSRHHIIDPVTGKRVSFGVVRIAHVDTAVWLSRKVADQLSSVAVCCYHSRHTAIARFHIERNLEHLLRREKSDDHIFADPLVRKRIDNSDEDDVIFTIVATPVEEVGRDHHFDWAVVEPSSTQSIVQLAGRVLRHVVRTVSTPNIALLAWNYKAAEAARKGDIDRPVFCQPGLEFRDEGLFTDDHPSILTHLSHRLEKLLDFNDAGQIPIDARLRFENDRHSFARYDDLAINQATRNPVRDLLGNDKHHLRWTTDSLYDESPLRAPQPQITWTQVDQITISQIVRKPDGRLGAQPESYASRTRHPRDFLVLSLDEAQKCAADVAKRYRVSADDLMTFTAPDVRKDETPSWDESFGWYLRDLPDD